MMSDKLIVFGPNLRKGGGLILLKDLLSLNNNNQFIWFIPNIFKNYEISNSFYFKEGIIQRLYSEIKLFFYSLKIRNTLILNGSMPFLPIFGKKILFIQNRLIIDGTNLSNYKIKTKIRIKLERLLLKLYWNNINYVIVQTSSMKESLIRSLKLKKKNYNKIKVIGFYNYKNLSKKNNLKKNDNFEFIFPAYYQPHKNFEKLLLSWSMFIKTRPNSKLYLTISETEIDEICEKINIEKNILNSSVFYLGEISHEKVLEFMHKCDALIFPSKIESFGLPLLEAKEIGLPIIASELDYVRDVCNPQESFDPNSSISIYRALNRFCLIKNDTDAFHTPLEFLKKTKDLFESFK